MGSRPNPWHPINHSSMSKRYLKRPYMPAGSSILGALTLSGDHSLSLPTTHHNSLGGDGGGMVQSFPGQHKQLSPDQQHKDSGSLSSPARERESAIPGCEGGLGPRVPAEQSMVEAAPMFEQEPAPQKCHSRLNLGSLIRFRLLGWHIALLTLISNLQIPPNPTKKFVFF